MGSDTGCGDLASLGFESKTRLPQFPLLSAPPPSPPLCPAVSPLSASDLSPSLPLSLLEGSLYFFCLHSYRGLSDKHKGSHSILAIVSPPPNHRLSCGPLNPC